MNSSTVAAVKTAIITALAARAGLAGVQVEYADPAKHRQDELIYFGNTRGRHEIAAIRAGRKPRNETYTLDLYIGAVKRGETVSAAEDRVAALLAEVEGLVADDPQLTAAGLAAGTIDSITAGDWEIDPGEIEPGRPAAAMVFGLEVRARLS